MKLAIQLILGMVLLLVAIWAVATAVGPFRLLVIAVVALAFIVGARLLMIFTHSGPTELRVLGYIILIDDRHSCGEEILIPRYDRGHVAPPQPEP